MQTTFTTNFKCNGCVSKALPLLNDVRKIKHWDTDLADPGKLLRVELIDGVKPAEIISGLAELGFTATMLEEVTPRLAESSTAKPAFQWATYKPLLLVVAYITGATTFAESIHDTFDWHRAMSYFMGFFFLGFAFFKLLNIAGFADAFSTYDVLAKRSRRYAITYPWIEVGLGILFLTQSALIAANIATALIMTVGLIGVVTAVRRKQAIQCACLGSVFNLPMSYVTIVENSIMIAMSAFALLTALSD
jgi:Methylamine utilisation protein MauE